MTRIQKLLLFVPIAAVVLYFTVPAVWYAITLVHVKSAEINMIKNLVERETLLHCVEAKQRIMADPKYQESTHLNRYEFQAFSQTGQDGIIAEILRRIGTGDKSFVEFGVGDGTENNTALLLLQDWHGLWIEGDTSNAKLATRHFASAVNRRKLQVLNEFITAENVESLFRRGDVPDEPAVLSIDIDLNDYWVWKALTSYRPRLVVIEYNSLFPPNMRFVVPYDPKKWWDNTANSGASLLMLHELGQQKGYRLVACDLQGSNAFFVRSDIAGNHFCKSTATEHYYEPQRYYLQCPGYGHPRYNTHWQW